MRTARMRDDRSDSGAYYHLMNRTAGTSGDRPFGDIEKEKFVKLMRNLAVFYTLEIVGYCVMSNHFHLVVWAPQDMPDEAEALRRFELVYPKRIPPERGSDELTRLRHRMRDFSDFSKQLQMQFTAWFNRTRPQRRRGGLWRGRFKSVLLEGSRQHSAVWNCLAYVELNPVRAELVDDPADYRFSSWGRFCGSGKHPFQGNFTRHLRRTVCREMQALSAAELATEFRSRMAAAIELKRSGDREDAAFAADEARIEPSPWLRADRRVRFWTHGVVIGSKSFVMERYAQLYGQEKAHRRRFGRGTGADDGILFAMRRPSET